MKKSIIGPDFEKKESVPPYKESKHALKLKHRVSLTPRRKLCAGREKKQTEPGVEFNEHHHYVCDNKNLEPHNNIETKVENATLKFSYSKKVLYCWIIIIK